MDPAYLSLFLVLLLMDVIIYGFQSAVNALDEKEFERKATEENTPKNQIILKYVNDSAKVNKLTSISVTLIHIVMGGCFLVWLFDQGMLTAQILPQIAFLNITILGVSLLHILVSFIVIVLFMYIIICFGIMLPRKIAERNPQGWVNVFVGLFRVLDFIFMPLLALSELTAKGLLHLIGMGEVVDAGDVIEREIIDMVNEGHVQGVIEANEAEMIHNIFEYGDKEAQDIMTNRSNIVAIDGSISLEAALQYMLEESYSRYPVYQDTMDSIVGVIYLKDAMRFFNSGSNKDRAISEIEGLLRKAEYTPLTRNIDVLFETLQSKKLQMAIVVDEYGQTAGLVTMEDILEEIVGKIQDEYDEDEEFIEERSNDAYVMEGMTPLQDIEDQLKIDFGDTMFETLNGFIIGLMDHIPQEDEDFECEYKGYNFKVLSIENMRVQSVLVQKIQKIEESEKEE